MVFFILAVLCVLAGVASTLIAGGRYGWGDWMPGWSIVAAVILLVGFVVTGIGYQVQICNINDLVKYDQLAEIRKDKAESLQAEFALHLAKSYPELERSIFKDIKPSALGVYLVQYPQLKSSETLIKLVESVNALWKEYYAVIEEKVNTEASIKNISRSPWFFSFVIPTE